jgi:hypothetical protein
VPASAPGNTNPPIHTPGEAAGHDPDDGALGSATMRKLEGADSPLLRRSGFQGQRCHPFRQGGAAITNPLTKPSVRFCAAVKVTAALLARRRPRVEEQLRPSFGGVDQHIQAVVVAIATMRRRLHLHCRGTLPSSFGQTATNERGRRRKPKALN